MDDPLIEQVSSALVKIRPAARHGITAESTLDSLALDSLDRITLLFELEDSLGVSISDDEARSLRTVGDIIECVRRRKGVGTAAS